MYQRSGLLTLFVFIIAGTTFAQDTLPYFSARTLKNKVLISWKNTYGARITSITIQRSSDSLRNFTSIGSLLEPNNPENGYVDTKAPDLFQYYRIFVTFTGGNYLYTKSKRPSQDTVSGLFPVPVPDEEAPKTSQPSKTFVASKYIYTSGKENTVSISLPLAEMKRYAVTFYDDHQKELFRIDKITETLLILEKVNFVRSGWYFFELFEDGKLLEKHKFYIPKEGKYGIPPGEYNRKFQ